MIRKPRLNSKRRLSKLPEQPYASASFEKYVKEFDRLNCLKSVTYNLEKKK